MAPTSHSSSPLPVRRFYFFFLWLLASSCSWESSTSSTAPPFSVEALVFQPKGVVPRSFFHIRATGLLRPLPSLNHGSFSSPSSSSLGGMSSSSPSEEWSSAGIKPTPTSAKTADPSAPTTLYEEYVRHQRMRSFVKQNSPLKSYSPIEVEYKHQSYQPLTFSSSDNSVLFRKGEPGYAMYKIKSGNGVCTIDPGNSVDFDELAGLFNQPRATTVRAGSSTEAAAGWRLSPDQLFDAPQDAPLGDNALELLKEKNQQDLWLSTLQRASFGGFFDLIRTQSRPKKKNVTFHSIVSSVYVGMFLLA